MNELRLSKVNYHLWKNQNFWDQEHLWTNTCIHGRKKARNCTIKDQIIVRHSNLTDVSLHLQRIMWLLTSGLKILSRRNPIGQILLQSTQFATMLPWKCSYLSEQLGDEDEFLAMTALKTNYKARLIHADDLCYPVKTFWHTDHVFIKHQSSY